MCFSAEASFATGAVLVPAGLYCAQVAWTRDRAFLPLAITPLVFGLQQAAEGFVWLGFHRGDTELVRTASLAFLFFALWFWPVWIPLAAASIERRSRAGHARAFVLIATVAAVASSFVYFPLVLHSREWLHTGVAFHSIRYEFESRLGSGFLPRPIWQLAYVAAVTVPLLTAVWRPLRAFGIFIGVSAILAHIAFWYAFVSVWCLFAAVLSIWMCRLFSLLAASRDEIAGRTSAGSRAPTR